MNGVLTRDDICLTTAGTAGTLLHAREHKTLSIQKIYVRVREHVMRSRLQEHPEAVLFDGHIALLGRFGYVHSQRGASAAGDEKYSHTVARGALLLNHFLELLYRTVRQTYHYFLLGIFKKTEPQFQNS